MTKWIRLMSSQMRRKQLTFPSPHDGHHCIVVRNVVSMRMKQRLVTKFKAYIHAWPETWLLSVFMALA